MVGEHSEFFSGLWDRVMVVKCHLDASVQPKESHHEEAQKESCVSKMQGNTKTNVANTIVRLLCLLRAPGAKNASSHFVSEGIRWLNDDSGCLTKLLKAPLR